MTTTADRNASTATRVFDSLPPAPKGTVPLVGQFVCLFHDGVVTTGWLMEEPREQAPDPVGMVHLDAQMLTADGVVVYAHRSRQEWLDAERDDRRPSAAMLFTLHRKRKAELHEIVMAAHQYADDNDLCERFDEFLDERDLPSRNDRTHSIEVAVNLRVTVEATGIDEDVAYERLDREQVIAAVRETLAEDPFAMDYEHV